ncbi:hypothetical protein V501_09164, partial [Pseudogymnoascus sp. VKM F-4519 (FW-2642)]
MIFGLANGLLPSSPTWNVCSVHESAVAVQQDDDDEMTFSWTSITHTGGIPAHVNMGMGAWMEKDMFDGSGGIESPCAKISRLSFRKSIEETCIDVAERGIYFDVVPEAQPPGRSQNSEWMDDTTSKATGSADHIQWANDIFKAQQGMHIE